MAINPGADLLTEALAAADPSRAKAAEERLSRLAQGAGDAPAAPAFQEALASGNATATGRAALSAALFGTVHPARRGGPYEQFEVVVLKSLFEMMLPAKATSVFGSGFAGEVWKSMLAESLAGVAGQRGVAGIARSIEARRPNAKSGGPSKSSS